MYISSYALHTHLFIKLPEPKVFTFNSTAWYEIFFDRFVITYTPHHQVWVWWMQACGFKWMFLVTNEIEHTFMYSLALEFLFCVNCILKYSLTRTLYVLSFFSLLIYGSHLCDWTRTLCLYVLYFPKLVLVLSPLSDSIFWCVGISNIRLFWSLQCSVFVNNLWDLFNENCSFHRVLLCYMDYIILDFFFLVSMDKWQFPANYVPLNMLFLVCFIDFPFWLLMLCYPVNKFRIIILFTAVMYTL